jgi:hypothetical protein
VKAFIQFLVSSAIGSAYGFRIQILKSIESGSNPDPQSCFYFPISTFQLLQLKLKSNGCWYLLAENSPRSLSLMSWTCDRGGKLAPCRGVVALCLWIIFSVGGADILVTLGRRRAVRSAVCSSRQSSALTSSQRARSLSPSASRLSRTASAAAGPSSFSLLLFKFLLAANVSRSALSLLRKHGGIGIPVYE